MPLLTNSTSLSILLGIPSGLALGSIATIARWEASAFAQCPHNVVQDPNNNVEEHVQELGKDYPPPSSSRMNPLLGLIAVVTVATMIPAGLFWAYGPKGVLALLVCFAGVSNSHPADYR